MENVAQVHGKKNEKSFYNWLSFLESLGYKNYYKDLNAKDYGIPQNRKRCFMVSRLDDRGYTFPEAQKLEHPLRDFLQSRIDDKYYLSEKFLKGLLKHNGHHEAKGTGFIWTPTDPDGVAHCLRANGALAPTDNTLVIGPNTELKKEFSPGDKVRKLTPCESWRLMGFTDEDFNKAAAVCSNSQLYKQAGNSIVKNVLMLIFKELIKGV